MNKLFDDKLTMAVCDDLSAETIQAVKLIIDKAKRKPNKQYNFVDPVDNISYCASVIDHKLTVSVVDWGPLPNASLYPVLTEIYGEPDRLISKPWVLDNQFMFLAMIWNRTLLNYSTNKLH